MVISTVPFSLNIPVNIGSLKFTFLVTDYMLATGDMYFSGAHNHGDFELRYVARGSGNQVVEGDRIQTKAGDTILIQPRKYHFQTPEGSTKDLVQYSIRFFIKPPLESSSASVKRNYNEITEILNNSFLLKDEQMRLKSIFENITNEILEKRYGYFTYLQSLCSALIIEYVRLSKKTVKNLFRSEELKYTGYWRSKLDRFFYNGYMNDIKLQDLADEIKVSRRHASRLVQREFGVTYVAKLMEVRLEQAKYQLTYTDNDLNTISMNCGFSSYSYFTTCFKKSTGLTPNDWRTANRPHSEN